VESTLRGARATHLVDDHGRRLLEPADVGHRRLRVPRRAPGQRLLEPCGVARRRSRRRRAPSASGARVVGAGRRANVRSGSRRQARSVQPPARRRHAASAATTSMPSWRAPGRRCDDAAHASRRGPRATRRRTARRTSPGACQLPTAAAARRTSARGATGRTHRAGRECRAPVARDNATRGRSRSTPTTRPLARRAIVDRRRPASVSSSLAPLQPRHPRQAERQSRRASRSRRRRSRRGTGDSRDQGAHGRRHRARSPIPSRATRRARTACARSSRRPDTPTR
jgi:hypothetical protein